MQAHEPGLLDQGSPGCPEHRQNPPELGKYNPTVTPGAHQGTMGDGVSHLPKVAFRGIFDLI